MLLVAKKTFWLRVEWLNDKTFFDASDAEVKPSAWNDENGKIKYIKFDINDMLEISNADEGEMPYQKIAEKFPTLFSIQDEVD